MPLINIVSVKRGLLFVAALSVLVLAGCLASDTNVQQDAGVASSPSGDTIVGDADHSGSSADASAQSPITPSPDTPALPEHTHSFSAATCLSPKICSCGMTDGTVIEHSYSAATCISPKTCTVCGMTDGEATGHKWTDATYTVPKSCTVCGSTEGEPLDVPGQSNYHGHVYTGGSSSKKYHYESKCPGKNSHEITWDEVNSRGLEPCGTCVLK